MIPNSQHVVTEVDVNDGGPALAHLAERASGLLSTASHHGPVVIRGLDISGPDDLSEAIEHLGLTTLPYTQGNSPRTELTREVFTATDFPAEFQISLHNELSYAQSWPQYLAFACVSPPRAGGATLVAGGAAVAAHLPVALQEKVRSLGVYYHQFLHCGSGFGLSWQATFGTDDRQAVEREMASDPDAQITWTEDGLEIARRRPGLTVHPGTGVEVWFNQVEQWDPSSQPAEVASAIRELLPVERWPHRAAWGDGSPINPDELADIRQAYALATQRIAWQPGDLAVVDNVTSMHGREPFEGDRRVLVSLAEVAR